MWVVLPNFLVYRKNFVAVQIGSVRGSCAAVRCFDMPRRPPGDLHRPWVWDETDSIGQCQAIIDNESITYPLLERAASEIVYYAECRKLFRRALYRYATLTNGADRAPASARHRRSREGPPFLGARDPGRRGIWPDRLDTLMNISEQIARSCASRPN